MLKKGVLKVFSLASFIIFFGACLAMADMIPIYRFKGVSIPVKFKVKDKILDSGGYDLEFVRNSSPVLYFLRLMKKGKILEVIPSEEWPYGTGIVSDIAHDKNIPTSPTLKMTKNKTDKLLVLVFESGRNSLDYPMIRVRVKLPYEE